MKGWKKWLPGLALGFALTTALAILVGVSYESGQESQQDVDPLNCEAADKTGEAVVLSLETRRGEVEGVDTSARTLKVGDCDRISEAALLAALDALAGGTSANSSPSGGIKVAPCEADQASNEELPPGTGQAEEPSPGPTAEETAPADDAVVDCVVVTVNSGGGPEE